MIEPTQAPTSEIEIVQQAIRMVGKQQTVNTIDGGGALAESAQALLGTLITAELGSNRWRFAQNFQQINILTTLDPAFDGWKYECQIPADCLMVQTIFPSIPYLVFGDKILTTTNPTITLIYSRTLPVSKWPAPFCFYMVCSLAYTLGASVTNSDRMMARLEKAMLKWESRALFADGQSSVTKPFRHNPYVAVRYRTRTRGR